MRCSPSWTTPADRSPTRRSAGQDWSAEHGYRGYTSYASLNDLPLRDPRFGDLVRRLDKHVAAFAKDCAFDLGGKRLKLDSLWVNVLEARRRAFGAYPSAQRGFGNDLCRGAAGIGRR